MDINVRFIVFIASGIALIAFSLLALYLAKRFDFDIEGRKPLLLAFEQLAHRFHGTLIPEGVFGWPEVTFQHGKAHVIVMARATSRSAQETRLCVHLLDTDFRCLISCGIGDSIWKGLGSQGIEVGSAALREHFRIRGKNVDAIKRLLSPDFEARLQELRQLGGIGEIVVSIRGDTFEVRIGQFLRDAALLNDFVDLALDLFALGSTGFPAGIEFLPATPDPRLVICQICGDDISSDEVRCRKCQTPHHRDCWEYNRGCSTYGCGEKRFTTLPKSSARKAS